MTGQSPIEAAEDPQERAERPLTNHEAMAKLRALRDRTQAARTARTAARGGHGTGARIAGVPLSKLPPHLRSIDAAEETDDDRA